MNYLEKNIHQVIFPIIRAKQVLRKLKELGVDIKNFRTFDINQHSKVYNSPYNFRANDLDGSTMLAMVRRGIVSIIGRHKEEKEIVWIVRSHYEHKYSDKQFQNLWQIPWREREDYNEVIDNIEYKTILSRTNIYAFNFDSCEELDQLALNTFKGLL